MGIVIEITQSLNHLITRLFLGLAAVLIGACRPAQPPPAAPVPPRAVAPLFDPAQAHSLLEGPARDAWQQPRQIVGALRLRPGQTVADVGAGSGYLLPHLSRAVGKTGTVYAEEIQREYLPDLRRRARALGNVRVVLGAAADPGLPEGSVDCFVLLTVYHEVREPVPFLRTLRRIGKPNARLAIIDFDAGRKGYPPAPAGHEMPEQTVLAEAAKAGWRLAARHEFLSSQFFLIFCRAPDD